MNRSKYLGLLVALAAVLPLSALAATSQSATMSVALAGGALSITAPAAGTFPNTAVSAATVTANIHNATWQDDTATQNGWNGTVAVQQMHIVPTWVTGTGSGALANQNSNQYTGPLSAATYNVTVTNSNGSNAPSFSWTGAETGSSTLSPTLPATLSVGTLGATINFAVASYNVGNTYSLKVGNLATSALTLAAPVISVVSGGTPPVATGGTATIPGGTTSTVGTAVKFVTAPVGTGNGAYSITPGFTLSWTPSSTFAASYVGSADYTIVSGP